MNRFLCILPTVFVAATTWFSTSAAHAQPAPADDVKTIDAALAELRGAIDKLRHDPRAENLLPDVHVYAKAAEWIVRHNEFFKPEYAAHTRDALKTGLARAAELAKGTAAWEQTPGRKILGYQSAVDESIQPYAISLPAPFGKEPERRWPLHLVLHGRGAALNEVAFIHAHDGKPATDDDWIQLDVFGRTNNAYRFAGEADVFEALADVKRRFRIDDRRIVLHGFSMGGAGSWHLGLHYPSLWCSVGPGAGFVDFYKYQKITTPLPFYQELALSIYNPIDYTLNAFDVPICTYGGEKDEQLVASTEMVERAAKLGLTIKLLVGPGMGHAFHPESRKEFMAFHLERQQAGRAVYPRTREIRFTTRTLKYNACDWVTIEELITPYRETVVEAKVDEQDGILKVKTRNVAVLQLGRDLAETVEIDGDKLPLAPAAEGLLPGVYFENGGSHWSVLGYNASLAFPKNADVRKRHNLQGPIDDAFMQPFVCVRGTGTPWNEAHAAWASWTLERFAAEFDKWMRGKVPIVNDTDVTNEMMLDKNVILFGDPGSNAVLAKVAGRLPVRWTKTAIEVNGEKYDPAAHGVSFIYPNPMAPRKYVVVNSGHTFHAADFKNSNAWLFPRLGDIAVQKFEKLESGGYKETVEWADFFNSSWKLPSGLAPTTTSRLSPP
ncbi:MAG: prolyl oligopeptidase family serine peptidase [Deltaproteobacteria bacterium]